MDEADGLDRPERVGIGINPTEPNVIYAATNDHGIFQSVDSGTTWSNVSPPRPRTTSRSIPRIRTTNHVYAATRTGMWWSSDHGATWEPRGLSDKGVFSVVAQANGVVHAGTPVGAAISTDHGATWSSLDPGLGGSHAFGYAITVDPNNRRKIFTSQLNSTISVSLDGGEIWQSSDTGYLARAARGVNVDPTDSSRVYAGSFQAAGLYKSLDYGDTWTKLVGPAGIVQGITVDPGNHLRVFAATAQGVFKSENGRGTWTNVLPQAAWNITFVAADSDVVYATSKTSGVYKSKDGGASWYQVNVDLTDMSVVGLAMDPERPKTLYVSTPTGVFKTITGGE